MHRLVCAIFTVLLAVGAPARADQADERLPPLFAALTAADSVERVAPIEREIWSIWLQPPRGSGVAVAMNRGLTAMMYRRHDEALEAFDVVTRLAPDFAEGWNKRATVRYLVGDYEGSVADIERTLALEPRHFGALSGLGLIRVAQGRPVEALEAFEAALAIHPFLAMRDEIATLRELVRGRPL
jgi:tetratricopeptide (TPR) repeat protein